jgi:hypothetical protein
MHGGWGLIWCKTQGIGQKKAPGLPVLVGVCCIVVHSFLEV